MEQFRIFRLSQAATAAAVTLVLSACGGGAGSSETQGAKQIQVNGTAAVGAPIANAALNFTCVAGGGNSLATTDANGSYSLTLDATLPCLVTVDSGSGTRLSGAITAAGVANVTPFTHLALQGLSLQSLTPDNLQAAWSSVQAQLQVLGIGYNQNPFTTSFKANGVDPMDQALDQLQAQGVTSEVLKQIAIGVTLDETKRKTCEPTNANPYGSCWRVQTPGSPGVTWANVAGNTVTIGSNSYVFQTPDSWLGFPVSYTPEMGTDDAFVTQQCNAGPKLAYQLISPKARQLREDEFAPILKSWETEGEKLHFYMLQDCKVASGQNGADGVNLSSAEVAKLTINADGSGTFFAREIDAQSPGGFREYTENYTAAQMRDVLFHGKPFPKDPSDKNPDPWDTYATVYVHMSRDNTPTLAVSLRQKRTDGGTGLTGDMFGTALMIEHDVPGVDYFPI